MDVAGVRLTARFLTSIVVAIALVAACSGGDSGEAVATGGDSADDGRPQSFDDLDFRSPISELLGFDSTDRDTQEAQFAEEQRQIEQIVAECMAEKGFEYTPFDGNTVIVFGDEGDGPPYFSDEWIDLYGFGITTQRFAQSAVGPDLVGYPDERDEQPEAIEDPNQAYIESLSEGEQQAYYEALHGPPIEFEGDEPPDDFGFEPQGCYGEAYQDGFGLGGDANTFYEAFGDEMEALYERLEADPRVVAYRAEVNECASESGYSYTGERELYETFESRLGEIGPNFRGDPFEEAGLDPESMSEEEIQDFFENLERLDDDDKALLAELQAEELEMARVIVDCGGGPLNEQFFLADIRIEYEQQFLDDNAAEIAELGLGEG